MWPYLVIISAPTQTRRLVVVLLPPAHIAALPSVYLETQHLFTGLDNLEPLSDIGYITSSIVNLSNMVQCVSLPFKSNIRIKLQPGTT